MSTNAFVASDSGHTTFAKKYQYIPIMPDRGLQMIYDVGLILKKSGGVLDKSAPMIYYVVRNISMRRFADHEEEK